MIQTSALTIITFNYNPSIIMWQISDINNIQVAIKLPNTAYNVRNSADIVIRKHII